MATGLTLITDAFLELGIGALGESLSSEMSSHGLRKLNRMWSSWGSELGMVYASTLNTHTWPASTASQTIGSGGDIDTTRPIKLTGFQMRIDSTDYTLTEVSYEQYEGILRKTQTTTYPFVYAYKREYPLGILYVNPMLSSSGTARIQSKDPLTAFTLAGTVSLPEGYEQALVTNLAIELAPAYGRNARPELIITAQKSKKAIKAINNDPQEMWPDCKMPGIYTRYSTTRHYNG